MQGAVHQRPEEICGAVTDRRRKRTYILEKEGSMMDFGEFKRNLRDSSIAPRSGYVVQ